MAYSSYNPSLYVDSLASRGMNAIVQQSYDASTGYMGGPSAGACPQGSINSGCCESISKPVQQYVSGEIPLNNPMASGAKTNPPYDNLSKVITQAFLDTQKQTPVTAFDMQCCPNPAPCQEEVAWRARFKGCAPSYADDPALRCEVNYVGDRFMVADLNPLLYERGLMLAAEPDPYAFQNARQMFMQFILKDWTQTKDPYMKMLPNLDQSFCLSQNTQGPPKYTMF